MALACDPAPAAHWPVMQLSRRPPSVRYPLRRSAILGMLLAAVALAGAAGLGAWVVLGTRAALLPLLAAFCLGAAALLGAAHFWWHQADGALQFDGQAWILSRPGPAGMSLVLAASPEVLLDLQGYLWVRILPAGHPPLWLWLERSSQPEHWMDLRRAVYSRARPGIDNADETARQAAAGRES